MTMTFATSLQLLALFSMELLCAVPDLTNAWELRSTFASRWRPSTTMVDVLGSCCTQDVFLPLSSNAGRPRSEIYMGQRGKRIRRERKKALQEPTPPRIETPYGPIRLSKPPRICDCCGGRGLQRCSVCEGRGAIRATGARKTNPIRWDRLVGSQWTSVEIYHGHRHHKVLELRGSTKKWETDCQVRMTNCCGDQRDFWIPAAELKDKTIWRMGWQTLEEIERANGGPLLDARVCFLCKGGRILRCLDCDGKGEIPNYEPLYN